MDLRQLRYFLAVAQEGSFTQAARRLHLSQPPLSTAVAQLERELGVTLLTRLPRGVTVTEAGRRLSEQASWLLAEAERVTTDLKALGQGRAGRLRLGVEPIGAWNFLSAHLVRFARDCPKVKVELVEAPPGELMTLVLEGGVDLAFVPSLDPVRSVAEHADTLESHVVCEVPLVFAVPREWTLDAAAIDVERLMAATWVLPRRIPGLPALPEAMDSVFTRLGRAPERIIDVSTPHTGLSLVGEGLGVTVATRGVVDQLAALRVVDFPGGLPRLPLLAVSRRRPDASPPVSRFMAAWRNPSSCGEERSPD